jgi:hypothetical protein
MQVIYAAMAAFISFTGVSAMTVFINLPIDTGAKLSIFGKTA